MVTPNRSGSPTPPPATAFGEADELSRMRLENAILKHELSCAREGSVCSIRSDVNTIMALIAEIRGGLKFAKASGPVTAILITFAFMGYMAWKYPNLKPAHVSSPPPTATAVHASAP